VHGRTDRRRIPTNRLPRIALHRQRLRHHSKQMLIPTRLQPLPVHDHPSTNLHLVVWRWSLLRQIRRRTQGHFQRVSTYRKRGKRGDGKDLHLGAGFFKKQMLGGWHWFLRVMILLGLEMGSRVTVHHRQARGMDHRRMWKGEVSWTCL
jgi:hypothetical protein